ncbi:MAG TPA: putative sulfate exporter family transporter [Spirochaetota bacterium]
MRFMKENAPGIGSALCVALLAFFLGKLVPIVGGAVFGIVIGILVSTLFGQHQSVRKGLSFTSKKILQAAIVVLGGGINLMQVYHTGLSSLYVMIYTLSTAFLAAYFFGRKLRIPFRMTSLIGMGTAICGGSAIAAIAPIIEAEDREISYAISTVFMFNIAAVMIFPALGHLIGFSQQGFGLWAGTAINDTSSVVAAAYSFGNEAGSYATIVKLTRTTMIIPISLMFAAAVFMKKKKGPSSDSGVNYRLVKILPWFIILFLGASLLNTLGVISPAGSAWCTEAGKFLITLALSAIGLNSDIRKMIETGYRPLLLGMIVWVAVAVVSVLVQKMTGQI